MFPFVIKLLYIPKPLVIEAKPSAISCNHAKSNKSHINSPNQSAIVVILFLYVNVSRQNSQRPMTTLESSSKIKLLRD